VAISDVLEEAADADSSCAAGFGYASADGLNFGVETAIPASGSCGLIFELG
jgi:hypothetical protein